METLSAGDGFGPYIVEGLVAGGGMGQVYAARHDVYKSVCAMKVLHANFHDQEDWRKRFTEEGLVGAQLKHPNVLSAREIVEHDGRIAIIMDLVKGGQTLEKVMSREFPHGLPLADALQLFLAVTQGMEYLHAKGIVHGDMKPENVMVEGEYRRPESWTPKVTDFGTIGLIAHPVVIDGRTAVVATPRYASPEHLRGVDRIEVRSDVYCLGLLLHYLLSGQHVSDARTVREAAMFVMEPISTVHLVDQPEVVQRVFRRATAVVPADRYQDCRDLALAVRDALDALGVKLELEDVAADLATEVDPDRAAAQRQMAAAAKAAEDAPPPPKPAPDPDELPTEVEATGPPSPAPLPPSAPSPAAEPEPPTPSQTVPAVPTEEAMAPTPPKPATSPARPTPGPEPLVPVDPAPKEQATMPGAAVPNEEEDPDTGDSLIDLFEDSLPRATPAPMERREPIHAGPQGGQSPLVPLFLGVAIAVLLGLAVLAALM